MLKFCNQMKFIIKFPKNFQSFNQSLKQRRFISDLSKKMNFPEKIDPNAKTLTMLEIKDKMLRKLGLDTFYKSNQQQQSREHLLKYTPEAKDLPPRSMNDSFTSVIIKLRTESQLRDVYITEKGFVRLGRILEDIDLFAVWVCHKHVLIPNLEKDIPIPYTFVTAVVDKITFSEDNVCIENDIRISGHVSWVGTSSMEIFIWVESVLEDGTLKKITKANFLMAARNATNTKAAPVNSLIPKNDYEKKIMEQAVERKKEREKKKKESFVNTVPTPEEQKIMHGNFLKTQPKNIEILSDNLEIPPNHIWMDKTNLMNVLLVFPDHRNAHNTIFGGYLLRKGFESAKITASLYTQNSFPTIKYINDISFHKPVQVSTILIMKTFVTYTEDNYVQIVCLMQTRTAIEPPALTNIYHYTFKTPNKVPTVIPKSYLDNLWYLLGRRQFLNAICK